MEQSLPVQRKYASYIWIKTETSWVLNEEAFAENFYKLQAPSTIV